MLDISVKIEGDKVVIEGLNRFAAEMPKAVQRGMQRAATGIYRGASEWLKGPGSKTSVRKGVKGASPGSYPVPVRTGHLRRSLNWLKSGQSKTGDIGTFTAGPHEVVVYNSARYADTIHEGRGSSARFGPRRFLTDALEIFNQGERIKGIIEEEINQAIQKKQGD